MVVLACGPAAVAAQSGGEDTVVAKEEPTQTPAPTFTPMPAAICYTLPTSKGGSTVGCEVDGPRNVPQHLRRAYSRHMEWKAEREEQVARGVPAEALESRKVDLSIYVRKADAVGPLVEFLEANGASRED